MKTELFSIFSNNQIQAIKDCIRRIKAAKSTQEGRLKGYLIEKKGNLSTATIRINPSAWKRYNTFHAMIAAVPNIQWKLQASI